MDNLTIKFDDNSYIDDRYITNKIKTINSDSDTSEVGIYYNTNLEDGDDVYYIEETNEFVIVSTDGYIRTYFYPRDGIEYFDTTVEK